MQQGWHEKHSHGSPGGAGEGGWRGRCSDRRADSLVVDEAGAPLLVQRDLDQIDAPRSSAGEERGRAPQSPQRIGSEPHPRPEALARAAGLDLDHDQGLVLCEEEIDLGPARVQASRQEAPAAGAQGALDEELSGASEAWLPGGENAQRQARPEASEELATEPGQTLVGSAFSSMTGSLAASITLWTAARENLRRTLSATCTTTTSAVVVTTVP